MTEILIKRLSKDILLPKYETVGSSGLDLSANINSSIDILPGQTAIIPTGLSMSIKKVMKCKKPRSGIAAKKSVTILNTPGTMN